MIFVKKKELVIFSIILISGFIFHFYRFNWPIADWHSWRQADTSAVSRNFIKNGFDILHPQYDDISNVQTGFDNPKGYRFVEFPLYNLTQASLFLLFNKITLEEAGRLVTIFASLFSTLFIYLLVKKHATKRAGLFAAAFYTFIPYNIFYGRTILPDPSMVMAILGGVYFFDHWAEENKHNKIYSYFFYLLAVFFTISAFLLKPYALFFVLPMFWIAWKKWGKYLFLQPLLWIFLIITITPLIAWRIWIMQYPEGIPVNAWLFNGGNIRFTGAFFYWIFAERISKLILGYWALPFVLLGLVANRVKNKGFFLASLVSSILYVTVIARGNVQHDYYQILIIPTLAMFFGIGVDFLFSTQLGLSRISTLGVLSVCILFTFMFGWYQVRDYFNINNYAIVSAGRVIDALIPKSAKIVAPYNGDTSFLYQTKRKGWPSFEKPLPDLISMGASYLVLVNPSANDYNLGRTYKIISATKEYILFDLHKKP